MVDLFLHLFGKGGESFVGTLQLPVFVKVFLGIFRGRQQGI